MGRGRRTFFALVLAVMPLASAAAQQNGAPISEADKSDYRCWLVSSISMANARANHDEGMHQAFERLSLYYLGKLFGRTASADLTNRGQLAKTVSDNEDLSKFVEGCYQELDHNIATFSEPSK